MYSAKYALVILLLAFASCGDLTSDLIPSNEDKRGTTDTAATGSEVGQHAPDFTLPDTTGGSVPLSQEYASADAIVLYFTMWCPICSSHIDHMQFGVEADHPNVKFFLVDYLAGSVEIARNSELSNGVSSKFSVIVDIDGSFTDAYRGNMGTTIVIDKNGIVRMNELYNTGENLSAVLTALSAQ